MSVEQDFNANAKGNGAAAVDASGHFKRLDAYLAEAPEKRPFIVDGLLYRNTAHQFMGTIKAGKTLFMLLLVKAILRGQDFIGQPTAKTNVLYVTEQPRFTFQQQLRDAGFGEFTNNLFTLDGASLYVVDLQDLGLLDWSGRAALIRAAAKQIKAGLVVIDTFIRIALIEEVASAGQANCAFERIIPLVTENDCALVLNWHERKAGGTIIEAAQGTVAHGGAVDILLRLQRVSGQRFNSHVRQVEALGRVWTAFEVPQAIEANAQKTEYHVLGSVPKAKRRRVGDELLKLLPVHEPGLMLDELLDKLKADCDQEKPPVKGTVKNALDELLAAGLVTQTGKGYNEDRSDPFRYHLAPSAF
jgi:voltage-gated potassium channel Kch